MRFSKRTGPQKRIPTLLDVTCQTGKRPYVDFHAATEFAKRTGRQLGAPIQPYRCKHCTYWHTGNHNILGKRPDERRPQQRMKHRGEEGDE